MQTLSTQTEVIILVDKKIQSSEVKCDKSVQIETEELLETQTRVLEFEEFNCYYCDAKVLSESDMEDHRVKCAGKIDYLKTNPGQEPNTLNLLQSNLSQENFYRCDYCGAECSDERNLDEHISTYHEVGTFHCDICPISYPTNADLYYHKQICHEDKF